MPRTLAALSSLLFLLATIAPAQQKKGQGKKKQAGQSAEAPQAPALAPAKLAGQLPGERASNPGKQGDWPAIAYGSDGTLWLAWVEWNDKDADRVLIRRRAPGGSWSEPIELADGNWDHYQPAIAARGQNAVIVWPGQSDGNFDLYWTEVTPAGRAPKAQRLTRAPHSDFNVRATADSKGNVTIAWQSFRSGNSDIYARRLMGAKWGPETRISTSSANDWEPSIATAPDGTAWISWDSYEHGNYDVFLGSFDGSKPGPVVAITTEPSAQFHSSVAVDPKGRVWVAWDDGGTNWGKDFSQSSAAPGSRGLHYSRSIGMRVYAGGRVQDPAAGVSKALTGRMTRYAELPHLMVDGGGSLALIFRHWTHAAPNEIYHFYATRLEGGEWSLPWQFSQSSGHNSQYASLALAPSGAISLAYASDGRSQTTLPAEQAHALHYNVYVSDFPKGASGAEVTLADAKLPPPGRRGAPRPRHRMTAGGKQYTLMLGDCHRHTDIRGHSGVDGSILDTHRYAMDAAQLDFLGTSDHNEVMGGRWPDGLRDYQWWWTQKAVDLMTHAPVYVGMYSYEHSMNRPAGHRNVLFLKRGAPLRMIDRTKGVDSPDNSPPALWKWWEENVLTQPGQKTVIVPHTFAAGPLADWNWPNARFDCLLEIYQGCRGSYEAWRLPDKEKRGSTQVDEPGHFAQDALARKNTYGFVSFSDHGSTHNSWAGVWALSEDRKGIIDGMYDRRTFAASDEIIVRATADGRMVGQEWLATVAEPPRIEATVEAPDTILRIDVVKDGKYVYTARPNAATAKLSFRDSSAQPGRSYYYVRVFQRDPENPEGDPEIAWASPFYVTYK
jgi:hypothetical protein